MEIQITARHSHLSEQFQGIIREKVEALNHFGAPLNSVRVILDAETKEQCTAEIVARVKDQLLSSRARAENMGKALDAALEKTARQLTKLNQKKKERSRTGGKGAPADQTPDEDF